MTARKSSKSCAESAGNYAWPAAFRARILVLREKAREYAVNDPDYSLKWRASFAKFDQQKYFWKIPRSLLTGAWTVYYGKWPRWGMMLAGECWELGKWEPIISGIESGLPECWPTPRANSGTGSCEHGNGGMDLQTAVTWPTPKARDCKRSGGKRNSVDLGNAVLWPTPNTRDWKDCGAKQGKRKSPNLGSMVHYPTPTASMVTVQDMEQARFSGTDKRRPAYKNAFPTPKTNGFCGGSGAAAMIRNNEELSIAETKSMLSGNGGQLNPDWVEWLMGWPVGFTDIGRHGFDWRDWICDPAENPGDILRITKRRDGRVNRLKAVGNGQVPICAAVMFDWGLLVLSKIHSKVDYEEVII